MTAKLLWDNSAWARLDQPAVPQDRADEIAGWLEQGRIATCLPFLLEAGYSAWNPRDHDELLSELMALPNVRIDEHVESRSVDAQRQLARAGHHRLPPVDLIIAALADVRGLGVLHYDNDYEIVSEKTDLGRTVPFAVEPMQKSLAPIGTGSAISKTSAASSARRRPQIDGATDPRLRRADRAGTQNHVTTDRPQPGHGDGRGSYMRLRGARRLSMCGPASR